MPTYTTNYNLIKPNVNDPVDEDLWGGYLNDDLDDIDALIKTATDAGTPIGSILDYTGTAAPANYLLCYGQAISRVTYASLFAVIGASYGSGDGATTFNLPDFRGRVGAGQDDMGGTSANRLTGLSGGVDGDVLGASGGAESHTLTTAETPAHQHFVANGDAVSGFNSNPLTNSNTLAADYTSGGTIDDYVLQGSATAANRGLSSSTGGGGAHNNVQPTIIVNKIIRYA